MEPKPPRLDTQRLVIRMALPADAPLVAAFLSEEREFLAPYEPPRKPEYFTTDYWRLACVRQVQEFLDGRSLRLWLFDAARPDFVLGRAGLSRIERGGFHACNLGYALRKNEQGKGLMHEALSAVLGHAFGEMALHRIEANYMPHNERSGRVLEKLGFTKEGLAREYLHIDGKWQDHVLTALTNKNWNAGTT
jgi:ribosomal-protein-alanine N-acetyltransferase